MSILSVSVPVPATGDGPIVSISALVGPKTVVLAGTFRGSYDLLASHDGSDFVTVASFDAGSPAGIAQTVPGAMQSVRLRSRAQATSAVACEVSGVDGTGQNHFDTIASVSAGFSGRTASVDLATSAPPTGPEDDICLLCRGLFQGQVVVEGSTNNVDFNPVGAFQSGILPASLGGVLEFNLLVTLDKVRYVRLFVDGVVLDNTVVTIGGRVPAAGPSPGGQAGTLASSTEGRATTLGGPGEEILYEEPVDLSVAGATFTPSLSLVAAVTGGSGTIRAYLGPVPGTTAGSTLLAQVAGLVSTSPVLVGVTGAPVANPGGRRVVQVTGESSTPATDTIRVYSFSLEIE